MKIKHLYSLLLITICWAAAFGSSRPVQQTVTLYAPPKYSDDFSRATFSFERAGGGIKEDWDLLYGNMSIDDDLDWLSASTAKDNRSLVRDMGQFKWSDYYKVPVITPLPKLKEGEERTIKVDASGDTGKAWARNNGIFVKAVEGHMYALHVKDADSDFYVLFRVESIERGKSCTISWQMIASPEQ